MTRMERKRVHKIRLLSIAVMVVVWPVSLLVVLLPCTLFPHLVEGVQNGNSS